MNNEEVLNKIQEKSTLQDIIMKRKGDWIGHSIRGKGILTTECTVEGERRRGRKILKFTDDIKGGGF